MQKHLVLLSATILASTIAIGAQASTIALPVVVQAASVAVEQEYRARQRKLSDALETLDEELLSTLVVRRSFANLDIFGLRETAVAKYQAVVDSDPWMFFQFEFQNLTASEMFVAFIVRMDTEIVSGPTQNETFLDLSLTDADGNGNVWARNTSARFDVIDDPENGSPVNDIFSLGTSPNGGFAFYQGEGTTRVFDVSGPGPNSDDVAGADGYNKMFFFFNTRLSAGDSLKLIGSACYGGTTANCPTRSEITSLPFLEDGTDAVIPLPAPVLFLGSALFALAGIGRLRRRY